MKQPLTLTWPDKDRVLLRVDTDGQPVWGDMAELVPRPLIILQTVPPHPTRARGLAPQTTSPPRGGEEIDQNGAGAEDNLLIQGDNLIALKSLEERFAEKIQCVYIDPPFNTRNAFVHYPDDLEDMLWLSMMRPRLALLKTLLKPDGLIVSHIDHRELAQLKLLMDEIFGKENFVSLVTVKVKDPAGVGQQSLVFDVCEYLLIYARNLSQLRLRHPFRASLALPLTGPVKGYNKAMVDFGEPHLVTVLNRRRMGEIKIYRCPGYKIKRFGKRDSWEDYLLHFDRIFADYNPSGGTILKIRDEIPPITLSYMEYTPSKGKDAGKLSRVYFLNRRILAWLKDIADLDGGSRIMKRTKLTNIWEISNAQLSTEGGVEFRQGKKPEALISRILSLATAPGDWILDSFLGSGTTAAVAHKMGRRWIGIESGTHAQTHCLPRLKRVVSGADQTGISKQVCWKGGGSFRYCTLEE